MARDGFVVSLLTRAFKLLTPPDPEDAGLRPRPVTPAGTLARRPHAGRDHAHPIAPAPYHILSHSRPLDSVGGDWSDIVVECDDSLWAIAADVTGHGYPAYLVAGGLPHLWEMPSIAALRARGCPPHELLDALSEVLEPVLPEAVFVEATLARFTAAGRAAFSGAGFCRVALRRSGDDTIGLHHLGGLYLGLGSGRRDHLDWAIHVGDEVMMASDGLYEQPDGDSPPCQLEASLARRATAHLAAGRALHDAILAVLDEALRGCAQRDDITVLTIRYRQGPPAGREAEHVPV
jgi:serine phosphatase RsbU (regulator of sigma subunit)